MPAKFDQTLFNQICKQRAEAFANARGGVAPPPPKGLYTAVIDDWRMGTGLTRTDKDAFIWVEPVYRVVEGPHADHTWPVRFTSLGAKPGQEIGQIDILKGFLTRLFGQEPEDLPEACAAGKAMIGTFVLVDVVPGKASPTGQTYMNTYLQGLLAGDPGTGTETDADADPAEASLPAEPGNDRFAVNDAVVWEDETDGTLYAGVITKISKKGAAVLFEDYEDEELKPLEELVPASAV